MTIKQKLVLVSAGVISSFLINFVAQSYAETTIKEYEQAQKNLLSLKIDLLELRKDEKGFLAEKTQKSLSKINDTTEDINQLSSQNARSVEEIASASEHMAKMSVKLSNLLEQYKA